MQNIYLSPHFELREFTESATAQKHGIVNEPPDEAVENLKALCVNTLEPLREALGLPIVITSGYRCKALNDLITHHSTRSQHVDGCAADFWVKGPAEITESTEMAFRAGKGHTDSTDNTDNRRKRLVKAFRTMIVDDSIDFDQLILYPSFIHVSYVSRERNRRKLIRAFGNGKYQGLSRAQAMALG